ncbi:MAG TPA: hypothetical protein VMV22_11875 [Acidimicrobiales bacterium]|nr:hypothetical protein [Acidimicrobiales bacterium]
MAFTNKTCEESGVWTGHCGHGEITVKQGERFPECPGCRRGIDWHLVAPSQEPRRRDPRRDGADWADEGWWPGKTA